MTRKQLLENVDSRELQEWAIYDSIYPIGDRRGDINAAMISSTFAAVMTGKKQDVEKFMPKFKAKKRHKKQTLTQMFNVAKALNAAFGGEFRE